MSAVASKEMSRLHDLMCVEALEGGLDSGQKREFAKLATSMPEVNTNYYWEALGAADLALYGASLVPPGDARKAWLQDASAHFGWAEPAVVQPVQLREPVALPDRNDPLDETIAVDFAAEDYRDSGFAGDEGLDTSIDDDDLVDPLDQTILNWDSGAIDVDQYASDRGLRDSAVLSQAGGNALGWWVLVGLAMLVASAFFFKPQIQEAAASWGLVPVHNLQGEESLVTLDASGAAIGGFVWDGARQKGLLSIDAMPASVDSQRQFQVWLLDNGRAGAAIPVALLRTNLVAHQIDIVPSVLIKQFGGLLISSELLGGALLPSNGAVIATVAVESE